MSINEILSDSIFNQFAANNKLNLFYKNLDFQNHFLEETKSVIRNYKRDLLKLDQENQSQEWIELMTERALKTFCSNNQYIDSRKENVEELHKIYSLLWEEIIEELRSDKIDFEFIQRSHLSRLTNWLVQTNGFVKGINDPQSPQILEVPCSEYSANFQVELLNIDIYNLLEPVLDIGCGPNAHLLNYLREKGIQTFGLDRLCQNDDFTIKSDWLDFEFKPLHWGTLISNLSFALHFTNHHHRKDGEYILYARKYMEILNSLKTGGTFYYAPGLPFIEAHLPKDKFKAVTHRLNEEYSYTRITRL